jgi:hypothetical protein
VKVSCGPSFVGASWHAFSHKEKRAAAEKAEIDFFALLRGREGFGVGSVWKDVSIFYKATGRSTLSMLAACRLSEAWTMILATMPLDLLPYAKSFLTRSWMATI